MNKKVVRTTLDSSGSRTAEFLIESYDPHMALVVAKAFFSPEVVAEVEKLVGETREYIH